MKKRKMLRRKAKMMHKKAKMMKAQGSLTSGALSSIQISGASGASGALGSILGSASSSKTTPIHKVPPPEAGTIRKVGFINGSALVTNSYLQDVVTALQKQVNEDFFPVWGLGVDLNIVSNVGTSDAVIYVVDNQQTPSDQGDLGFHDITDVGIPVGFVFVQTALMNNEKWEVTASHELLELIADPFANLAANGTFSGNPAFFAYEVCDSVEADQYMIGQIPVSNFVFPSWFIDQTSDHYDFLGELGSPFSLAAGGFLSYWPAIGNDFIEVDGRTIVLPTLDSPPGDRFYGWVEVDGKTAIATPAATPGVWERRFMRYSRTDPSLLNLTFRDVYTIDTTD